VAEGAGALPAKIDERWKDAAYVFAANLRNSSQFYSLLQAIHKEAPESKRQFSDVYEQVKRFARKPATPDVGELMASIAWVGGEEEEEEEEEPIVESPLVMEDGSTSRTGSANVARYVTLATPSAGAHVALESLRTQLDPYRKRALLSALVPLTQVAAQMVLSAAAGSTTIQEGTLKRVLHRTQKALTPLLAEERPLIPLILACAEFSTPLATSLDVKKDANIWLWPGPPTAMSGPTLRHWFTRCLSLKLCWVRVLRSVSLSRAWERMWRRALSSVFDEREVWSNE